MTRLTPADIEDVPKIIIQHDLEIKKHVGVDIVGIAKLSAGYEGDLGKAFRSSKAKAVSITSGKGVISGFAQTVSHILNHIGIKTDVAGKPDMGGFAEALRDRCNIVFAADDEFYCGFNFRTSKYSYNFIATGRIYSAVLEIKCGGLKGNDVAVIGAGRVGSAAVEYLCNKGAKAYVYDPIIQKVELLKTQFGPSVMRCNSVQDCLAKANMVILAAPGRNFISAKYFGDDTVFSAPAIPLGFTKAAFKKIAPENLIHDPLELGTAAMAAELMK
ncbi:MAG: 3-methylornithyl-N6-L-lysine dehydrogenase PylD [Candidatus Methanomethylicus sp.]|nr:3-methylornithyl-N6-L-lysine dehydrogenase PylD [Candidatus Methanomethylicus sp.]